MKNSLLKAESHEIFCIFFFLMPHSSSWLLRFLNRPSAIQLGTRTPACAFPVIIGYAAVHSLIVIGQQIAQPHELSNRGPIFRRFYDTP